MEHRVINGVFAGYKFMRTTGNLHVIVEVPKEMALEAVNRLGTYDPAESKHVAVAVLQGDE